MKGNPNYISHIHGSWEMEKNQNTEMQNAYIIEKLGPVVQ